jgi:NAD+ diphosphatase
MAIGGYRRDCPNCGAEHFPRTDPVVIMVAIHGEGRAERVLLGRQRQFMAGMYSALAGFMEPGETIEDAVRRETLEESGIAIGRVAYHASQPWPFPMSLMIGCHAEALSEDVHCDETELEDCRWFGRDEVKALLAGTHPAGLKAPAPVAIAHHLLRAWAEAE